MPLGRATNTSFALRCTDQDEAEAPCNAAADSSLLLRSLGPGDTLQTAVAQQLLRPSSPHSQLAYPPSRDRSPVLRPVWMEAHTVQADLASPATAITIGSKPQLWTIKSGSPWAIVPASHHKCACLQLQ